MSTLLAGCGSDDESKGGPGSTEPDLTDCRLLGECDIAPELDRTVATTVYEGAAFLFTGEDPLQKDVPEGTIEPRRAAVVRGQVQDIDGEPLLGVKVSVLDHPELGWTLSRADGQFDMVVNGGERLVFVYELEGYMTAQRSAQPAWQRYVSLPAASLIEQNTASTKVAADSGDRQIVAGEAMDDDFGTRQPLVVFEQGTTATAVLSDGTEQALDGFNLHVTEYPLEEAPSDEGGARFAPGTTPSGGLPYTLDFTVEEAEELDADSVVFSKPVTVLVENFGELDAGTELPFDYYNKKAGQWEPSEPLLVLDVVGESDGVAQVDVDGDGVADDGELLDDYGISENELAAIAEKYDAGQSLMRGRLEHFSSATTQVPNAPKTAVAPNLAIPQAHPLEKATQQG